MFTGSPGQVPQCSRCDQGDLPADEYPGYVASRTARFDLDLAGTAGKAPLVEGERLVQRDPAGAAGWNSGYLARLLRAGSHGVLYVQPDGHNPTGATMPLSTRETIGRLAAAGWLVVADETMRPLHLAGDTTASLAAADHRVIVVSSLSKTVWGGLHLGWIRAPAGITRVRDRSGRRRCRHPDRSVS